jgi:hypothetical protein
MLCIEIMKKHFGLVTYMQLLRELSLFQILRGLFPPSMPLSELEMFGVE